MVGLNEAPRESDSLLLYPIANECTCSGSHYLTSRTFNNSARLQ